MLGWLLRPFRRPPTPPPEEEVFRYHDGTRERKADPLLALAGIEKALGAEWPTLLRVVTASPPANTSADMLAGFETAKRDAAVKVAEGVTAALGVPALDGGGLTVAGRVNLAARFLVYMTDLAEAVRPFSDSRPVESSSPASAAASSSASA